jgi:hypothetical protein
MEWDARQAHGNWLVALCEGWLNSGALFDEERRFSQILDRCGLPHTFDNPSEPRSMITPVYLKIRNPLDTSAISPNVVERLRQVAKVDRTRPKPHGVDQWDKTTIAMKEWFASLEEDLKNHTDHAWTTIPEKVTQTLQSLGYDGIRDRGGKLGGPGHTVWIAFLPNQIKSAIGNNGNFDVMQDSIVASTESA